MATLTGSGYIASVMAVFLYVAMACLFVCNAADTTEGTPENVCECIKATTFGGFQCNCRRRNLTTVPQHLPTDTRELDLRMNNISTLPDYVFERYTYLEDLRLTSNVLVDMSDNALHGLHRLKSLHLDGNKLEIVPKAFKTLQNLLLLHLDANHIKQVPAESFRNLRRLKSLHFEANSLTSFPTDAFQYLAALEALDLSVNKIERIPDYAFSNLTNLVLLRMADNQLAEIEDYAFQGLNVLTELVMNRNKLKHIPPAFAALPDLETVQIEDNNIQYIPDYAFSGNNRIRMLVLKDNPIVSYGKRAFTNLPLKNLHLSEARDMTEFPDLSGATQLETLKLDRSAITEIPANFCDFHPDIKELNVHSNNIKKIPDLTRCRMLELLNLGNNDVSSLDENVFANLTHLKDLILTRNIITYIPRNAFCGLVKLDYLDLSKNKIGEIHDDAFIDLIALTDLNLSENDFPRLPIDGLQNLQVLKTFHNTNLREAVPSNRLPKIKILVLSYAYHCCDFIYAGRKDEHDTRLKEDVTWLAVSSDNRTYDDYTDDNYNFDHYTSFIGPHVIGNITPSDIDEYDSLEALIHVRKPVNCTPLPGPFLPCDDLFGWWSLRCGVWMVFLLAVAGNGIVLFVSISGRSKMEVPRFLICNLACADFCMGVYLGMLAIVDASTIGEFQQYAIRWQMSPGCLVAGFLGVFSSELSVFTLTVITVERYYAISHALQFNKRLTLKSAGVVMTGGWIFCIGVASLPLFEISDYRKFAICLPFETSERESLAYVCFIMIFNAVSFIAIIACYIKIYISILGSQAWNTKDFRVAKRMAILIFTDFLCWSPIILFSATAAFGYELISLNEAKILTIFVLPLNSCANPFLYAIFTKQFKRDCVKLCKRIEESSISRSLSSLNSRRVSIGCGSSWRHLQLHSPMSTEKRSSCSNSYSGVSSPDGLLNPHGIDGKYFRKQSGDSLLGGMSISSEDKVTSTARLFMRRDSSPCKDAIENMDGGDQKRRLSVGLAGSESQIVIHFDRKDVKSGSDDSTLGDEPRASYKKRYTRRRPSATRGTSATGGDGLDIETVLESARECDMEHSFQREDTVKKDITAQELFAKYRQNKEKLRNAVTDIDTGKLQHGNSAPNVQSFETKPILRLPVQSDSHDKTSHINEWRKSSHLSFLWRNSLDLEGHMPSYKSNSLIELPCSPKDFRLSPCKRRSLSSRHEGYILLKNNNRDSAYEDEDEMLEYQESIAQSGKQCRQLSAMSYVSNAHADDRQSGDVRETTLDEKHSVMSQTSQNSKESGISSETCCHDNKDKLVKHSVSTEERKVVT
ncbi:leucine-rich repeat-containing G-protein coupled receptor 5-like [Mizuhopecten yessoensis]|uniref:Leucine-rich repeat-containing G-protein coupled receptor 5 n=1 Tax=Mizuhopecten yessoensis TaxID=6573 RepID=A0A210PLF5_MIZYE|nr:leucine-rich repeat-containing G-protein coupled receptor 5-like [Mizuhopecten yessoensis]OWF37319.1 Leucine-rich repeat-containing G-protein coupled receptor 5 [Mizuhopecten yessoensis]